ncbi:MAG: glycosyltransferase family 4 protein [Clostridiaceae bacterium]|nr:glycosyltransferase family 4 protein [Clostridiaceae bacterium]
MKRILVLTNSINGLYSFRRELIDELINQDYCISISAPVDTKTVFFKKIGCNIIETRIKRRSTDPISDLKLLLNYIRIIQKEKPNIVLTYTIKPNVYGGIACRLLQIPYLVNITGLGTSIENNGIMKKIALKLYKIGLKKASCVFFQNSSNQRLFLDNKIAISKTRLIPRSGVNLNYHCFEEYPDDDDEIKFLFIGRIMKDKGINELLDTATRIKAKYPNVHFDLVGDCEENYIEKLKELQEKGIITYHGRQDNVHSFIKNSHATILPSYHEGTANVLLESASTGRPVLASRVPGCQDTFDEGVSGLGFEVKNVDSLVETIVKFIELPYEKKKLMGIAGRRKMEREYDRQFVIKAYMEEIRKLFTYQ